MSASQPSTNDYDLATHYLIASFIAWQTAVANNVDSEALGLAIVANAQANIETLMLGKAILINGHEISIDNDIGKQLRARLAASVDDLANIMEKEANNVATN